jgi:hypothetical protein
MENQVIITAASNKFFPSLVNLIGSIKDKYPDHPTLYVYDLGLFPSFRRELKSIGNLKLLEVPKFSHFWRKCYTWKTYILSHPLGRLNFYLDAGCQVLKPLNEAFEIIERDDYFAVAQNVALKIITPNEYKDIFQIDAKYYDQTCVTAGIFGFKQGSVITRVTNKLFSAGKAGLALGFSPKDLWKNKGVDQTEFVRECEIFRHDTTLLSLLLRQELGDFVLQSQDKFGAAHARDQHPEQVIWNLRMNYLTLDYVNANNSTVRTTFYFNRLILNLFMAARWARLFLKGKIWNIKNLSKSAR